MGINRHRVWLPAVLLGAYGCNHAHNSTDMQCRRMDETKWDSRSHWRYMADNALLHDMSVADIHFVPHTSELSGTGTARLDRLSPMLDVYGGIVRYETTLTDEALVKQRLEHVREYIAMSGCNMDKVQVQAMLSGGRGIEADRAIHIREKGTQPPGSGPTAGSPAGPGAGKGMGAGTGQGTGQ